MVSEAVFMGRSASPGWILLGTKTLISLDKKVKTQC